MTSQWHLSQRNESSWAMLALSHLPVPQGRQVVQPASFRFLEDETFWPGCGSPPPGLVSSGKRQREVELS
jgi:hypothetical protein